MENNTWTPASEASFTGMTSPVPAGPPTMPPYLDYGLAFFLFVAFIVGVLGNGVTIWIFVRTKSLRTPPNMLIVNLAFSDISMVITNFPLMFGATIHGRWMFGQLVCEIYAFFGALFGFMSITTMTAIALDRHYVICHSMEAIRTVTKRRALYKVIAVWMYSAVWSILPFIGFGAYVLEGYGLNCTFDYLDLSLKNRLYVGTIFIFGFLLPLTIIIVSYAHIAYTLRQHRLQMMSVQNDTAASNDKAQAAAVKKVKADKVEWQIAKIGMMLTMLFCMSWMPYASVAFIGEFIDASKVTPMLQVLPVVLAKSSASWNPLVYAISHQRFKEALRDRFLKYCCGGLEHQRTAGRPTTRITREESRGANVRSTKTEVVELDSGIESKPTRTSPKGDRERATKTNKDGNDQAVGDASSALEMEQVNLVLKAKPGGGTQEEYGDYDNPASAASERDELTKL